MGAAGRFAASLCLLGAGACLSSEPVAGVVSEPASVAALIGDAGCSNDDQCRTLAVGTRACGGPERYLAWSTARTDVNALAVAASNDARRAAKAASNDAMQSTCQSIADPGAYCAVGTESNGAAASSAFPARLVAGTCRLRPAASRSPTSAR